MANQAIRQLSTKMFAIDTIYLPKNPGSISNLAALNNLTI